VVFTVRPLPAGQLPPYNGQTTWLDFTGCADLPLEVTGVSWRSVDVPATIRTVQFTPPVHAAIAPVDRQHATAAYRARYDETGFLRDTAARQSPAAHPYAHRAAEIGAGADRLIRDVADRASAKPPASGQRPLRDRQQQPALPPRSPGVGPR
jgi:hypothetical protein